LLKNKIKSLFGIFSKEKKVHFIRFLDPLGNFEIFRPKDWGYDENIAVVDGRYAVAFESNNRCKKFVVALDVSLSPGFNFSKYAKNELEGPSSGIIASVKKDKFQDYPAYKREYVYVSEGKDYFGGGIMFFTGSEVFSISWNAPEKERKKLEAMFKHMLNTLIIKKGLIMKKTIAG